MAPEKKNPVIVIVALMVFIPILALSKMRPVSDGGSTADASSGFSPILIKVILLVVVAFALAGSYLMKK